MMTSAAGIATCVRSRRGATFDAGVWYEAATASSSLHVVVDGKTYEAGRNVGVKVDNAGGEHRRDDAGQRLWTLAHRYRVVAGFAGTS